MATDATGTPTSPDNIPKFLVGTDAPTGNGTNAMMDQIQTIISGLRAGTAPGGKIVASTALTATGTPSSSTALFGDDTWKSVSTYTPPAPATSLPGSPTDKQQAVLVDSTSTPTFSWLMQYSSTASKWLFIGGSPLSISQAITTTTIGTGGYAALPTATSVVIPVAGVYNIRFGFTGSMTRAGNELFVAPNGAGLTAADGNAAQMGSSGGGDNSSSSVDTADQNSVSNVLTAKTLTAATLSLYANRTNTSGNQTGSISAAWMEVTPVTI